MLMRIRGLDFRTPPSRMAVLMSTLTRPSFQEESTVAEMSKEPSVISTVPCCSDDQHDSRLADHLWGVRGATHHHGDLDLVITHPGTGCRDPPPITGDGGVGLAGEREKKALERRCSR